MSDRHIYTPTELNREVKLHLEAGFSRIWLEAEVSNLSRPASGHLYFSLKDERSQIRCALFKSAAMKQPVQPENGQKVLVSGRISLYEPRGDYQMIVDSLQHAGEGLLQQQFEALKRKLEKEGLFDPGRKRPLPAYPLCIALITSPSGSVVRDMLHVLRRRWPLAKVRIYPVPVQGAEAPPALVGAVESANRHQWADVILLGRGGGSLEDLWAFNDEQLARAIAGSEIPIVSAVGHETDFSISDFVADLRAPTPSAAAELSTPDGRGLSEQFARFRRQLVVRIEDKRNHTIQRLDHAWHRLQQVHPSRRLDEQRKRLQLAEAGLSREMSQRLRRDRQNITHLERQLSVLNPRKKIADARERLVMARQLINREMRSVLQRCEEKAARASATLNAVSPLNTVGRGYSLLTATRTGTLVSSVDKLPADRKVTAQVADGRLFCTVEEVDDQLP